MTATPERKTRVRGRIRGFVLVCILQAILFHGYRAFTSPKWSYLGYSDRSPHAADILVAALIASAIYWILPMTLSRPSYVVLWVLYLVVVVPVSTIGPLAHPDPEAATWPIVLHFAVALSLVAMAVRSAKPKPLSLGLPRFRSTWRWFLSIALASATCSGIIVLGFGFEFRPEVALENAVIREIRLSARQITSESASIASYARNWLGKVLAPLLAVASFVSYRRAQYWRGSVLAILALPLQVIAFSATANVSLMLAPLFAIGLAYAADDSADYGSNTLLLGTVSLVGGAALMSHAGHQMLQDEVIRRVMQTSPVLSTRYFDYFAQSPPAYFDGTLIGRALQIDQYADPVPGIVASAYGLPEGTHANVNAFADGYAQVGIAGPLLVALVLAIVLRMIDRVSLGTDKWIPIGVLAMPAWSLADSGLLSVFLSHGLGIAILVIITAPKSPWKAQRAAFGPLVRPQVVHQRSEGEL